MMQSPARCTKPCLESFCIAVRVWFLVTIFVSAIHFIRWMRPQLIYVYLFFPGLIFEQQRGR
jgi:hypothetical protein